MLDDAHERGRYPVSPAKLWTRTQHVLGKGWLRLRKGTQLIEDLRE
jgi:hypothetical protein